MKKNYLKSINTRYIVAVALMAALTFAATYIKFDIPTPTGKTMVHLGNSLCLLSALLMGGIKGGLAAGIGSFFFDLTDPVFIFSAPVTFINKFIMAFVCGVVAHGGGRKGKKTGFNILGCVSGQAAYMLLYLGKNFLEKVLAGAEAGAALVSLSTSVVSSSINAVLAIAVASLLYIPLRKALVTAGLYEKFFIRQSE